MGGGGPGGGQTLGPMLKSLYRAPLPPPGSAHENRPSREENQRRDVFGGAPISYTPVPQFGYTSQ